MRTTELFSLVENKLYRDDFEHYGIKMSIVVQTVNEIWPSENLSRALPKDWIFENFYFQSLKTF